jgi:hypothetical protein
MPVKNLIHTPGFARTVITAVALAALAVANVLAYIGYLHFVAALLANW